MPYLLWYYVIAISFFLWSFSLIPGIYQNAYVFVLVLFQCCCIYNCVCVIVQSDLGYTKMMSYRRDTYYYVMWEMYICSKCLYRFILRILKRHGENHVMRVSHIWLYYIRYNISFITHVMISLLLHTLWYHTLWYLFYYTRYDIMRLCVYEGGLHVILGAFLLHIHTTHTYIHTTHTYVQAYWRHRALRRPS